ncbi:hypothetical protein GCM10023149_39910 [Mucilaginibacter gynuensis]|uniref:DoxX family protein n=1 Tax=Mucilaginibacter gynuensis TaxID=1302236 RepID=A0ABP8H1Z5_9SPHI
MAAYTDTIAEEPVATASAAATGSDTAAPVWTNTEKIAFRIAFIFFFILTVPLTLEYYQQWFNINWLNPHIRDLGGLGGSGLYFTSIKSESGIFGLASYINWGISLLIAIIGGGIWTLIDRKTTNYRVLYYFITVAVTFAMITRLQGLTFSKIFPSQMPELALTQLNTPFGDFVAQKLYWIQLSFVPRYETFLGLAELLVMILLFFRKTRAFGAALAVSMIGNIAISNHVYDGGVHVLASFYALGGTFVLWRYLPAIWNLLVREKNVKPQLYYFPFNKPWQKAVRVGLKMFTVAIYFVLSAYLHYDNYKHDSYKVPARLGLANSRGLYEVTEFKVNNQPVPYSPLDSLRWQNVTFEKWSTISFTVFNTFNIHGEAGRGKQFKDVDRTYESAGTGGGRRHYYYEADTVKKILVLYNKNKRYKYEKLVLHYNRPNNNRIVLWGNNEYKQPIYVVLDRNDKQYALYEGREKPFIDNP